MDRPDAPVIVVDLGYGDCGKGTVVDWLCATRDVSCVVRFSGGAQAAHHVVLPAGSHRESRWHRFAQFGSGTFQGAPTFLAAPMMVEPVRFLNEGGVIQDRFGIGDPFASVTVDGACLVTTPWHAAMSKAREIARGSSRHGSCGVGIGETASYGLSHPDPLRVNDLRDRDMTLAKLAGMAAWYEDQVPDDLRDAIGTEWPLPDPGDLCDAYTEFLRVTRVVDGREYLDGLTKQPGALVFEGSQGVLLDEDYGFHPHTTWSHTTPHIPLGWLAESGVTDPYVLGVLRTYTTRHGAGPFVAEDPSMVARLPEAHNGPGRFQGAWRAGHFDAPAHRYAIDAAGTVNGLAVTHCDRLDGVGVRACTSYRHDLTGELWGPVVQSATKMAHLPAIEYTEWVGARMVASSPCYDGPMSVDRVSGLVGCPVVVRSYGPTARDKRVGLPT